MIHYDFPIIETIDDVLPHIEGREEFRVLNKDWYTVVRYMVSLEDTFTWDHNDSLGSAIRRECRGLIFDTKGKLISRPFHKFFNCNEKEETQLSQVNLYDSHVIQMKLDGSMIRPIPTSQEFRLATKSGITDTSMNAEVFITNKTNYMKFINYCIDKNSTPIFEWVSRKNRIVIDYPEDNLILTAIRSNKTGFYVPYSILQNLSHDFKLPLVEIVDSLAVQNIELLAKQVQDSEGSEGIVIRFDSGHMVKIKSSDYVLKHRSKDSISQEKNVICVILNNSVDDLIPLLTPEDTDRLQRFSRAFWMALEDVATDIHDQYCALEKGESQKDFALIVQKQVPKYLQNFMYSMHRGESIRDLLVKQIEKSLSTQTTVDSARWMWGKLHWIN